METVLMFLFTGAANSRAVWSLCYLESLTQQGNSTSLYYDGFTHKCHSSVTNRTTCFVILWACHLTFSLLMPIKTVSGDILCSGEGVCVCVCVCGKVTGMKTNCVLHIFIFISFCCLFSLFSHKQFSLSSQIMQNQQFIIVVLHSHVCWLPQR